MVCPKAMLCGNHCLHRHLLAARAARLRPYELDVSPLAARHRAHCDYRTRRDRTPCAYKQSSEQFENQSWIVAFHTAVRGALCRRRRGKEWRRCQGRIGEGRVVASAISELLTVIHNRASQSSSSAPKICVVSASCSLTSKNRSPTLWRK